MIPYERMFNLMKSTGMVRRIDNLGRIVIPKEIRYTMHIHNGDPLEIYTDSQGSVIFKKYSPAGELSAFAQQYGEVLSKYLNRPLLVCDRDRVISAAGISRREYLKKSITPLVDELMQYRKSYVYNGKSQLKPVEEMNRNAAMITPIIASSDVVGAIILLRNEKEEVPNQTEITLVQVAATFLGNQMEK